MSHNNNNFPDFGDLVDKPPVRPVISAELAPISSPTPNILAVPGTDPALVRIVNNPHNRNHVSQKDYDTDMGRVEALASFDKARNKRIAVGADGKPYWAAEYPNVFTFNGQLRGKFDWVHKDPAQWTGAQQMANIGDIGGSLSHVIIETDQGEKILIRKTNDAKSAQKQVFDLLSLRMAEDAGKTGKDLQLRAIHTDMLADVVLVPGMPMQLGVNPDTGTAPRSKGNITKITGLEMNKEVASSHPKLNEPGMRTHAHEEFADAIRVAMNKRLGTRAVGQLLSA